VKKPSYVFDAWALVAYLKNEGPAAERVEEVLHQAGNEEAEIFLSLINLGEVYYAIGRSKGKTLADQTLAQIRRLPIFLLDVNEASALQAATYKMSYALSYADCFALATAVQQEAMLLTGDLEFEKLSTQFKQFKIERLRRA
jgi:predicted nucleic acid-binding protein